MRKRRSENRFGVGTRAVGRRENRFGVGTRAVGRRENRFGVGTLVVVAVVLAGCGERPEATDLWEISAIRKAKERGELVVATEPEFPPFESLDASGEIVGFDVDLAREIGKELGVKVRFLKVAFESIVAEVQQGNADLIISGRTTTAERALGESYSDPYFETVTCLLLSKSRASDVKTVQDLDRKGRIVAVKISTTGETAAGKHCPNAEIITFPTENAAALEVAQGKADAFLYDRASIERHHRENPDTTIYLEKPVSVEPYAIAVRKGDPETVAWLNLVLSLMRRDGRLKEMYARWGLEPPDPNR
jgi:polar amino acid transport system substrate-binding protein